MRRSATGFRQRFTTGLACFAILAVFPFSCQQKQPVAVTPPPPPPPPPPPVLTLAQQGDNYFDAGDYGRALGAYSEYLREQPSGPEGDRALFRLALIHALPDSDVTDGAVEEQERAVAHMRELVSRFPQSPLRPQAQLYVQLQEQILALRSEIAQSRIQVEVLSSQIAEIKQAGGEEVEQLRSGLKEREQRVRQLTEELNQLKAIDMQRRTTPPR
jgi:hypothetical protein